MVIIVLVMSEEDIYKYDEIYDEIKQPKKTKQIEKAEKKP